MAGSVLVEVSGNEAWAPMLNEMVLLCIEASWRSVVRERARGPAAPKLSPPDAKPLMLEYISDRIDTDDPIRGYAVRSSSEGWLQGFLTWTVFTTWTPYFRFTATEPAAAITADDVKFHACDGVGPGEAAPQSYSLCAELQACRRAGDPELEGVLWPRVAEISLLGALGCGGKLVQIALDEMAAEGFDYVVLQATDQAVRFYERMGFSRVGAVAGTEGINNAAKAGDGGVASAVVETLPDTDAAREGMAAEAPYGSRLYWARRLARLMVRELAALDDQLIFAQPVTDDVVPGYSAVIAHPVDLSTMRRHLVEGAECTAAYLPEDVAADFALMMRNCLRFNSAGSWVHDYGKKVGTRGRRFLEACQRKHPTLWHLPRIKWPTEEDERQFHSAARRDAKVGGYVHWTFPDQPVEDQYPSCLMARRLRDPGRAAAAALADAAALALATARGASAAAAAASEAAAADLADLKARVLAHADPRIKAAAFDAENDAAAADDERPKADDAAAKEEEEEEEEDMAAFEDSARCWPLDLGVRGLGPSHAIPARFKASNKLALRSNVTPRGDGFTAKCERGDSTDYLGMFETVREAEAAYEHAAAEWALQAAGTAPEAPEPPPAFTVAVPDGGSLRCRDEWLQRPCRTPPLALLAHELRTDGDGAVIKVDELRRRARLRAAAAAAAATSTFMPRRPKPQQRPDKDDQCPNNHHQALQRANSSAKRKRQTSMYNKVVTVAGVPPCYEHPLWFVYQYVPDMQWVHLCPMEPHGVFGHATTRSGRPRWRLVPEGLAREIDVSAARCTLIKHETVAKTQSADAEIFDILDHAFVNSYKLPEKANLDVVDE